MQGLPFRVITDTEGKLSIITNDDPGNTTTYRIGKVSAEVTGYTGERSIAVYEAGGIHIRTGEGSPTWTKTQLMQISPIQSTDARIEIVIISFAEDAGSGDCGHLPGGLTLTASTEKHSPGRTMQRYGSKVRRENSGSCGESHFLKQNGVLQKERTSSSITKNHSLSDSKQNQTQPSRRYVSAKRYMPQGRQTVSMHDEALTPVVASVLHLIMVAGCCTAIGIIVFEQMHPDEPNAPDVWIQSSAENKYLYHAGGDALPKTSLIPYDTSNVALLQKTSINGDAGWTVWKSGEYLHSSRELGDILLVWKNHNGEETVLYQNGKTGISPVEYHSRLKQCRILFCTGKFRPETGRTGGPRPQNTSGQGLHPQDAPRMHPYCGDRDFPQEMPHTSGSTP